MISAYTSGVFDHLGATKGKQTELLLQSCEMVTLGNHSHQLNTRLGSARLGSFGTCCHGAGDLAMGNSKDGTEGTSHSGDTRRLHGVTDTKRQIRETKVCQGLLNTAWLGMSLMCLHRECLGEIQLCEKLQTQLTLHQVALSHWKGLGESWVLCCGCSVGVRHLALREMSKRTDGV